MNTIKIMVRIIVAGICLLLLVLIMAVFTNSLEPQASRQPGVVSTIPYSSPYPPPYLQYPPPPQGTSSPQVDPMSILMATEVVRATATAEALKATLENLPTATPVPNTTVCFVDPTKGYSLWLPPGWFTYLPEDYPSGVSQISNYNGKQTNRGEPSEEGIKIDIYRQNYDLSKTFEEGVLEITAHDPTGTPKPAPYLLGKYEGFSRLLVADGGSLLDIYLPGGKGEVFVLGLHPATSKGLKDAITLLSTLDISGSNTCTSAIPSNGEIPFNLEQMSSNLYENFVQPSEFLCPTGTFTNYEALTSTMPLDMPFRAGET